MLSASNSGMHAAVVEHIFENSGVMSTLGCDAPLFLATGPVSILMLLSLCELHDMTCGVPL